MQKNRILALACCVGAIAPSAALASSASSRISKDAADGKLKHCYTLKQLKKYKKSIGSDVKQYSPQVVKAVKAEIKYAKHHKIHPNRKACQS